MKYDIDKLRLLIGRCRWTFAKTMPTVPHEYIVRNKCPLSNEEWLYIVDMQRRYGIHEVWGNYNWPYLHVDGFKYWTMGDTYENTVIINRTREDWSPEGIIRSFVKEILKGDINRLATFNLHSLWGDHWFGCPGRWHDDDDTNIMRAIYCVVFKGAWPNLSMDSLKESVYRGDTINTYRTMFGDCDKDSPHHGLDRFKPSQELSDKVINFHNICSTIGNMMVLPNLTVSVPEDKGGYVVDNQSHQKVWKSNWVWQGHTVNEYRGTHWKWHDFFDLFLSELRSLLIDGKCEDKYLPRFIERNADAFEQYRGAKGWKRFIDFNLLQNYVLEDYSVDIHNKGYYYWRTWDMTQGQYLDEANNYVGIASERIRQRALRMIDLIKQNI